MRCGSATTCNGFGVWVSTTVVFFIQTGAPATCNLVYDSTNGSVVNNATPGNC